MAFEHKRVCGECERVAPSWADRCPVCGSLSLVHQIVIAPPAAPMSVISDAKPARRKPRRAMAPGHHEPPHSSPARSTA
jgi:predicted amidophosphoribosyltransferase